MNKLPFSFMALAVIYILVGMAYSIHMSVSENFTIAPAHGHLNLLGFVLTAIFAFYYHLVPSWLRQPRIGEGGGIFGCTRYRSFEYWPGYPRFDLTGNGLILVLVPNR